MPVVSFIMTLELFFTFVFNDIFIRKKQANYFRLVSIYLFIFIF
ncbi:hypothetical protein NT04LS_0534 [Listeria seeligeri FSL S4-171]|nr:hypothetical protein NT04LS_0534 [Listeria seeligeri FSL S4-171]